MAQSLTATKSIAIKAAPERVWDALTDPVQVKQYMFGSDVRTDWKKGSPLIYSGMWEGKPFEDKGTILDIDPPHLLRTNYYSPLSGKPDVPESYAEVSYAVTAESGGSRLTVSQSNIGSAAEQARSEGNWSMVLESIRKLIEG